jgi:hypothetical protein
MEGLQVEAKRETLSPQQMKYLRERTLEVFPEGHMGRSSVSGLVPVLNRLDRWIEASGKGIKLPDWL